MVAFGHAISGGAAASAPTEAVAPLPVAVARVADDETISDEEFDQEGEQPPGWAKQLLAKMNKVDRKLGRMDGRVGEAVAAAKAAQVQASTATADVAALSKDVADLQKQM